MSERHTEISVLGSIAVRREEASLDVGPQLRRLLAALVIRRDSVVSSDQLIDIVWMGEPSAGADSSLKTYISRLRSIVDPERSGVITFQSPGYMLSMPGLTLDANRFETEVNEAISLLRTADDERAIGLLATALARWRGDAFAGFADEDWARPEAVRLQERRLEATELLIEARLGLGDHQRALAEAQSFVEAEPLRERPRALLMRSLFAAGRQAEALREFRRFRTFLAEEAGLDPSAELLDLEGRIARSDASLAGHVRALKGYEIGERLGEGAYAVVHRAVQPGVERDVAIKIIRSELADRPEFVRRFEAEAQIVATVEHPHVVPLYDFWREPGAAYLVMRLLRGGSVEERLRQRGPFSLGDTSKLLVQIGSALEKAHSQGVVHRDVRPANLLLDDEGSAYLADFGIALPTSTSDDIAVASPAYASPEMLRGEPTGTSTDVLSLAMTAFELLTGRLPFADSNSDAELIQRQLHEPIPSARATRIDLPIGIDEVLARATAKAPSDRHANIGALVEELTELLAGARSSRGTTSSAASRGPAINPYVGLNAFQEGDADKFHGREALVTEIVDTLARVPFVVVVGPSGSGKSSVVRAGVIPALRAGAIAGSGEWFTTGMIPGANPIDALEAALLRVAVNPPASLREQLHESGGLLRAVHRVLPDERTRLLIVIDQFEELFTMNNDEEHGRFLSELAHAIAHPSSPLRVVATLRADHYDVPLRHAGFAELAHAGTVAVRPMSPAELERVIVQPAASVGVEAEPALVAELVAGISERAASLPLLQFSLTELFDRRVSDLMLVSTHHQLGGLTGAVAARADRIVDEGGPADEAEARRIFGRLVTLGDGVEDTRRRAFRSDFGDGERTAWLLDAFVTARLLTVGRDSASRESTVEVAHEALLRDWPRLRDWLAEDRDDLRALRGISTSAAAWVASEHDSGELARGGRLDLVGELAERRPELLNEAEREWIIRSRAAADAVVEAERATAKRERHQNHRLRQLLVVAGVFSILALVAASIAVVLRNQAADSEEQADTARQEAVDAEAIALDNEERALDNEQQAKTARQEAVDAEAVALDNEERALDAQENADIGRLTAVAAAQIEEAPDLAILLALEANRRRDDPATQAVLQRAIGTQATVTDIFPNQLDETSLTSFSRDGSVGVARTVSLDAATAVWFDPSTGDPIGSRYRPAAGIDGIAVSGDGSVTAVLLVDGVIRFVDVDGTQVAPDYASEAAALQLSLDQKGERLLVGSGALIEVVDVATASQISVYRDDDIAVSADDVFDAALSSDGSYFVSVFESIAPSDADVLLTEGNAQNAIGYDVVDAETGELRERVDVGSIGALSLSSVNRLVIGLRDGTVIVRELLSQNDSVVFEPLRSSITAVAASSDGQIAAAASDGTVQAWASDGNPTGSTISLGTTPFDLAFTADGPIVASFRGGGTAVIDGSTSVMVNKIWESPGGINVFSDHPYYEEVSPDRRNLSMRRLDNDEVVHTAPYVDLYPNGVAAEPFYSSDGEWGLSVGFGGPVVVWSTASGERREFDDTSYITALGTGIPEDRSIAARPQPGGTEMFVAARDLAGGPVNAFLANIDTSEVTAGPIMVGTSGPPLTLDDGRIVMGGPDATVTILPARLDSDPIVIEGTEGFFAFDQDDNTGQILLGGIDGRVAILDPDTQVVDFMENAEGELSSGTFSPTGDRVAVLSLSDGVQLLDIETGRRLGVPMTVDGPRIRHRGLHWEGGDDSGGGGVWIGTHQGPIRFAAEADQWRDIGCGIVHRELTAEEWRTFVSDTEPQVSACS